MNFKINIILYLEKKLREKKCSVSINENLKVENICIKTDCEFDRYSCVKCVKIAIHKHHLNYLHNYDGIDKVKEF